MQYEMRLKGHLSPAWSEWFPGLTVVNREDGEVVLRGAVQDQAALMGIINQLYALNLNLIAVTPLDDVPNVSSSSE